MSLHQTLLFISGRCVKTSLPALHISKQTERWFRPLTIEDNAFCKGFALNPVCTKSVKERSKSPAAVLCFFFLSTSQAVSKDRPFHRAEQSHISYFLYPFYEDYFGSQLGRKLDNCCETRVAKLLINDGEMKLTKHNLPCQSFIPFAFLFMSEKVKLWRYMMPQKTHWHVLLVLLIQDRGDNFTAILLDFMNLTRQTQPALAILVP